MNHTVNKKQNLLNSCIKELQSCVDYVNHYSQSKEQHLSVLKDLAKEYCEIDNEFTKAEDARKATEGHFDDGDCVDSVEETYDKFLNEQPGSTSYEAHPIWRKICNVIEGEKPDLSRNESESDEELDEQNSCEEGIIPTQFEPPVDPITKKVIEDPCRNKKCGHVYEYSTVVEHLKRITQMKTKSHCLYIGCTNTNMCGKDLVKDKALKKRIEEYLANKSEESNNSAEDTDVSSNIIL